MPDLNSSASKLLQRGEDEGVSPGDQAAASSGSFKFPALESLLHVWHESEAPFHDVLTAFS